MSLQTLREALLKMPATGEHGFEGLVATLLSALTGYRFYVARSGDQPTDAVSAAGDVAIQAKRYDQSRLNETEFEGEFHKACRLCTRLDCYVLASTRTTAQLRSTAKDIENSTGVDVLLLQFDTLDSELPSLCIGFWAKIQHFPHLREKGSALASWAVAEAKQQNVVATIERLRRNLTESVPLAGTVGRKLKRYLEGRFGIDEATTRPYRFRIELSTAIARRDPLQRLRDWWQQSQSKVAAVLGEEGTGKSWVAATFAFELTKSSEALVLWLDSADWSGHANLEDAVDAGLMLVGYSDQDLRRRLVRKALSRWSDRLLVVLDGINERKAKDTAQRLLVQLHAAERTQCRVLFTTRPVVWKSDERALWNSVEQIAVGSFTEGELTEALTSLPTPVVRSELSPRLVELAMIPRYFRRTVELRARFGSLANVSKELVLWADLLAKVHGGDPQITESIGWNSSAVVKRALLALASAAQEVNPSSEAQGMGYPILKRCFGENFERIRSDLAEQRVVLEPNGEDPTPSPGHLTLGFALHIGKLAASFSKASVSDLAQQLSMELEPLLAQDHITEALFVALQLSALPNSQEHMLSQKARSALLLAWCSSQNSQVEPQRLQFWADHDLPAYLDFVEEVFLEPLSDVWENLILIPLKSIWRSASAEQGALDSRIRRWLKFVWRSPDLPSECEMIVDGHSLPIARSQNQLALSLAALAILSERPNERFLCDLAVACVTERLSTQRHKWARQPGGQAEETTDVGCKSLNCNLGAVLRWRYTERTKSVLAQFRALASGDQLLLRGLDQLEKAFDEFGWTRIQNPEQRLREGKPLFEGAPEEWRRRFSNCPELAMRDDLADLCAKDQAVISEKVERVFASGDLHSGYSRTEEDLELDQHLAWFAKYAPQRLGQLASRYRLTALLAREVGPALGFANHLPYSAETVTGADLLEEAIKCAGREFSASEPKTSWSLLQLHVLALTCFGEVELKLWLVYASSRSVLRREIHFYPIPILCPLLLSEKLTSFAREQARLCCNDTLCASGVSDSEFDFWANLGGLAGEPNAEFHQWADEQIRWRKPTGVRRHYWLLLWLRSAPSFALDEAVSCGSIVEFLGKDGLWLMVLAGRWRDDWSCLRTDFSKLVDHLPIGDVGTLLALATRGSDLAKWGDLIFTRALELVGNPPFERQFWGTTIYSTDSRGTIVASTCDHESNARRESTDGIGRQEEDLGAELALRQSAQDWENKANQGIRIWRNDQERLRTLEPGALHQFDSAPALETWRDNHPDAFRHYASTMLTRAALDPSKAFHIGGFVSCVIDALIPLDPDLALKMDAALRNSSMRVNTINSYGIATTVAAFWRSAGKGNQRCQEICRGLIEADNTDEELMSHAITAQAEGAEDVLSSVCRSLLNEPFAKERCLAVSLLAWLPTKTGITELEHCAANDSSGWVRAHAQWAVEVAKHEAATRRYYALTLLAPDRNMLLARLQVLLPALTPSARWWHRELEIQSGALNNAAPAIRAAVALFWHEAQNRCRKARVLFGRNVEEYSRGERVRDLRNPKPRLNESQESR